jgi:diguanylate cyclase (GGDEF)-like protein/PAS domain S-box-containing protein
MIDTVRVMCIAESSPGKKRLFDRLSGAVQLLHQAQTLVEGLAAFKENEYDLVLLSYDVEDFYSVNDVVKILLESDTIEKLVLFSEVALPDLAETDARIRLMHIKDDEAAAAEILELTEGIREEVRKRKQENGEDSTGPLPRSGSSLFDTIPIGLFRIDPEGSFIDCNSTLVSMFKAPNKEVVLDDSLFALFTDQDEITNWLDIIRKDSRIRGLVLEAEQYNGQKIWLRNSTKTIYNESGAVAYYDGTLEDITFQKKLEDKLSFLSTHDILTGLPNRNFFQLQAKLTLSQARYSGDIVAFLILDIDNFSAVNELGSRIGDQVLQQTAERAKALLRKSDLIARLGGDAFIVLLPNLKSRKDILAVAKKLSTMYIDPVVIDERPLNISISMGVSIFPNHGETESALIHRAQIAVRTVKERERGGYMIYSEAINTDPAAHADTIVHPE